MSFSVIIRAVIILGVIVSAVNATVDLKAICNSTTYPKSCYSGLSPIVNSIGDNLGLEELYRLSVGLAIDEVSKASDQLLKLHKKFENVTDRRSLNTIQFCHMILSTRTLSTLNDSLAFGDEHNHRQRRGVSLWRFGDLETYLTAAGSFHEMCKDGCDEADDVKLMRVVKKTIQRSLELSRNSLSILIQFERSIGARADHGDVVSHDIVFHS